MARRVAKLGGGVALCWLGSVAHAHAQAPAPSPCAEAARVAAAAGDAVDACEGAARAEAAEREAVAARDDEPAVVGAEADPRWWKASPPPEQGVAAAAPSEQDVEHADPEPPPTMWIDRSLKQSWSQGAARWFGAAVVDTGYLYLRPRAALGYGVPFTRWIGLEANPLVQSQGYAGYAGVKVEIPHFDLRAGARYFASFQRSYLAPDDSYSMYEMQSTQLAKSRVWTLEVEANAGVRLGPGSLIGLASVSYLANVPKDQYVYEETLRVMAAPPWILRGRAGYLFEFGQQRQASLGPVFDVFVLPNRGSQIVRAGLLLRFVMSRSFELRGSFIPVIHSPDRLGLLESDFTELGLRWRWASGP